MRNMRVHTALVSTLGVLLLLLGLHVEAGQRGRLLTQQAGKESKRNIGPSGHLGSAVSTDLLLHSQSLESHEGASDPAGSEGQRGATGRALLGKLGRKAKKAPPRPPPLPPKEPRAPRRTGNARIFNIETTGFPTDRLNFNPPTFILGKVNTLPKATFRLPPLFPASQATCLAHSFHL